MRDKYQHQRRSIRLRGYNYSQPGIYFVTVCAEGMRNSFGCVVDGRVELSSLGSLIRECWLGIPRHIIRAELDAFVIMPNHLHGIIALKDLGARHGVPLPRDRFGKPASGSLATIIRLFKQAVTMRAKTRRGNDVKIWQRNFYEHIVENLDELDKIRDYIRQNPLRWACDRYNSARGVLVRDQAELLLPWQQ